jgi:hypothetical protein
MKLTIKELKQIIKEEIQNIILENKNNPCWDGYKMIGMKKDNNKEVPNCVPKKESLYEVECHIKDGSYDDGTPLEEDFSFYESLEKDDMILEAEYQGRNVPLNKPMQGDVKKFKVYVKDPTTGNVKKVNFGDPNMRIKKSNPARRKSFRARHNCDSPGPKTKARYWSCKKW